MAENLDDTSNTGGASRRETPGSKHGNGASDGVRSNALLIERSARSVADELRDLATGQTKNAEIVAEVQADLGSTVAGLTELTQSIAAVRTDIDQLAQAADATASTLEETARSVKSVAADAEDLAAASEELLASAAETSASLTDMATRPGASREPAIRTSTNSSRTCSDDVNLSKSIVDQSRPSRSGHSDVGRNSP